MALTMVAVRLNMRQVSKSYVFVVLVVIAQFLRTTSAQEPKPDAKPPLTIVTLGDSITRGERTGVKREETFAALLEADIKARGVEVKVINVGIGGERTDGALARLEKDVLAVKPKLVTIMYGTNDSYVDKGQDKPRLTREEYRANLAKLVQNIRAAGAIPVIMTEPRWGKTAGANGAGEHPNIRLESYMEACREVARELKAPLVDHYAAWSGAEKAGRVIGDWTTDQCHPNPAGCRVLADAILPVVLQAVAPEKLTESPPLDLGGVFERHVMIPMRDGVKLSAYLYFPHGEGPWPVLLEQRYANGRDPGTRQSLARLAKGGYVVAMANFRGAQLSEGTWVGYRALGWGERKDSYDLVEWLAAQTWSTGAVGTFGTSQAGFAQNFLAVTQPPHLKAQLMIDTGLSLFHEGYRIGGTTRPERFKGMDKVCRESEHNQALLREWFAHPTYDAYWAEEDCTRFIDKMNVPCFTVGSWFDFMCVGSIDSYIARQHKGGERSLGRQQLLIGPWLHGRFKDINKAGEMTFPENARFPLEDHLIKWFDHHLKGIDNKVEQEPAVRYYVMGAVDEPGAPGNEWRSAPDWPIAAKETPLYLHSDKSLRREPPDSADARTTFLADPLKPNSIPGTTFPGAADARKFEAQDQVRTFTSEVLTTPVEWTGKIKAELFVSSDAKDTDFIVRVSDVYPDGRSMLLVDYVRRARYREGFDKEVFMEPGKVYAVSFDVGWLSQIFNKGHRIRVTVASTGAPFFEPNPNTGAPLGLAPLDATNTVVAENTLHLSKSHASRIIAPLVTGTEP